jgi:nucleoside diphosphate kinase
MADASERTFIMIKPDGVQRGIVGDILRRFEQRGFKLVALKMLQVKPFEHDRQRCLCTNYAHRSIVTLRRPQLYSKVTTKNTKVRISDVVVVHIIRRWDLRLGKKFYEPLLSYIGSGPVVAMVNAFTSAHFRSLFVFSLASRFGKV